MSSPTTPAEATGGQPTPKTLDELIEAAADRKSITVTDIPQHAIVAIRLATWPAIATYKDRYDTKGGVAPKEVVETIPLHRILVLRRLGRDGLKLIDDGCVEGFQQPNRSRLRVSQVLTLGTVSMMGQVRSVEPAIRLMEPLTAWVDGKPYDVSVQQASTGWRLHRPQSRVLGVTGVDIDFTTIMSL